jgi:hypothetical protein
VVDQRFLDVKGDRLVLIVTQILELIVWKFSLYFLDLKKNTILKSPICLFFSPWQCCVCACFERRWRRRGGRAGWSMVGGDSWILNLRKLIQTPALPSNLMSISLQWQYILRLWKQENPCEWFEKR